MESKVIWWEKASSNKEMILHRLAQDDITKSALNFSSPFTICLNGMEKKARHWLTDSKKNNWLSFWKTGLACWTINTIPKNEAPVISTWKKYMASNNPGSVPVAVFFTTNWSNPQPNTVKITINTANNQFICPKLFLSRYLEIIKNTTIPANWLRIACNELMEISERSLFLVIGLLHWLVDLMVLFRVDSPQNALPANTLV